MHNKSILLCLIACTTMLIHAEPWFFWSKAYRGDLTTQDAQTINKDADWVKHRCLQKLKSRILQLKNKMSSTSEENAYTLLGWLGVIAGGLTAYYATQHLTFKPMVCVNLNGNYSNALSFGTIVSCDVEDFKWLIFEILGLAGLAIGTTILNQQEFSHADNQEHKKALYNLHVAFSLLSI